MTVSLGDICRSHARQLGDEVALIFDRSRLTYGDLHRRASMLAGALCSLGMRHQDRIAIYSKNRAEYIEIFSAAELSGYIATTINFRLSAGEVRYIIDDSAPRVLFFEAQYAEVVEAIRDSLEGIVLVCLDDGPSWARNYEEVVSAGPADGSPFKSAPDDIMHIIYTSGTTGRPKGVMRTHRAEIAMSELMTTEVGILAGDRVLAMMPLFHVGARWLQLGTFLRGSTLVLHREFDPAEVLTTIEAERITVSLMAPSIIQRVLEHPESAAADLSSLHTLYYSSAPMPLPLLKKGLERLGPIFVQLYGMTEGGGTTLHKRCHRPEGSEKERARLASVGQAPYQVEVRVVDDLGNDCPTRTPGEVVTRSPTCMLGYWNNAAATEAALRHGWYHTGDVGYLDEDGFLFLVDRKKDMIISGGENIYSREVEMAIASHEGVLDVAVFGVPDEAWGEAVLAAVVLKAEVAMTAEEIIEHCRRTIASYKKPRHVVFLDELPRVTTGKVDKQALRLAYKNGQA